MVSTKNRHGLSGVLAISLVASTLTLVPASAAGAATTELFFSEYIEGSSNNKALEIYNGTGSPVDLEAGDYKLAMYFNGSTTVGLTIELGGTVADGDVFVVAQSLADAAILAQADQTDPSGWFNGDDVVVLLRGTSVVDSFGQIGIDPGIEWTGGGMDDTLRRKSSVCAGDIDPNDAFDATPGWAAFEVNTFSGLGAHTAACDTTTPSAVINEFSASTAGTDVEYIEVFGNTSTDLSTLTILHIEGDGTGAGTVDTAIAVGTTDASGFWLDELAADTLENGTITLLLVHEFTGSVGTDLDADNDGTFDSTPWSAVVDAVAVSDGGAGDLTYGTPTLGPNYDGLSGFAPGGASRVPDGEDTDSASDWVRNDFDLAGIPGNTGTPVFGEAINTPGASNQAVPEPEPPPTVDTDLVVNEVDYDQPGTDGAEFVEIKNTGDEPVDLDEFAIALVNGNGAVAYQTIDLPDVSLAAGDYFVICGNASNVANCDLDVAPDTNLIQNGSPDAVAIVLGEAIADTVSYEGDTGAPYTEGSGSGLQDSGVEGTSISRCGDGFDTDQNNADFVETGATPGDASDCACDASATPLHDIQGSGASSPLQGQSVAIRGIVVGDFQNNGEEDNGDLNGFHVQEEDLDADADPATSEGVFVFAPSKRDVSIGDQVEVRGQVSEFNGLTEITSVTAVLICSSSNVAPTPGSPTLPVESIADFEAFEGMSVVFAQDLVIAEYFNFDRFGEIVLTSERQVTPTAIVEPGQDAQELAEQYRLARITLDDGRPGQNPDPAIHPNGDEFTLDNLFRGGDTVANVTGVMDFAFGLYRIQPTEGADYTPANPRPEQHEDVGGTLEVASFNVLNYFTTLTSEGDVCGPAQDQECRGANDANELTRQRDKIIAALSAMESDVVGLIEIENHPDDVPTADLVAGLNDELGAGTYELIETGAIGTDAIRQALIYKPASVTPVGDFAVLDTSVDARFLDDFNRPVLAQTFMDNETGALFTVAVNHLKSKGSDCDDVGDPDIGDGQGNCNQTRTAAAEALVDWLASDPTGSGDRDVLVIGDLNSYDKEDPIDVITEAGYTDLVLKYQGEEEYSFVFDGQVGYLDHGLASPTIESQVTGATIWHINADEPDLIDYDTTFKQDAQDALYAPDPFRSSDHDPVIIGLDLEAFDFEGFAPPLDEDAEARAGQVLPVRFSLGGDLGLEVFFGQPQVFACDDFPLGPSDDALSPGGSGLRFDPLADQYVFPWGTLHTWSGTCRILEVTFDDGTYRTVRVEFR